MDALRPLVTVPGDYMVPRPSSMADMKSAEFVAKVLRGPRVVMTVMPPRQNMSMTRELVLWFVYLIVVSALTAYVAAHALLPNAPRNAVIRFAGLVSFIAYASALWQLSIWYSRSWGITIKATIDSLIYACDHGVDLCVHVASRVTAGGSSTSRTKLLAAIASRSRRCFSRPPRRSRTSCASSSTRVSRLLAARHSEAPAPTSD